MKDFVRVIIESPFGSDVERNKRYLRRAIRDCYRRGESPYASHRMLTDALDDLSPEERKDGIEMGFAWRSAAAKTVVYEDYGISSGMALGIEHALRIDHPIEYRKIGTED